MDRIAKFEKVSWDQFKADFIKINNKAGLGESEEKYLKELYEAIKVPVRATSGSAGYDFFMPVGIRFWENNNVFFPTGIRCKIDEGWVLMLFPKSGLGSKYGMRLLNTTGVVDAKVVM